MTACALLLAVLLAAPPAAAVADDKPLFEVVPPERAAFNYPPPPRVGPADYFTIAEQGKARCVIVAESRAKPSGAGLLKTYLDLATGADIPLLDPKKPAPPDMAVIHVGNTPVGSPIELGLPEVRYGDDAIANLNGYLVKTLDARTLVIRGPSDRATALGVVGFLKRFVGVRHYWAGNPGDLGDVVPKCPTLRVPQIEWRDWPYFVSRTMSGLDMNGPAADRKQFGAVHSSDFFRLNYTIPSNESFYRWLPVGQYGQTHPEYYPWGDGKRLVPVIPTEGPNKGHDPNGWQPCVSNPEVVKIMAAGLVDYFRKHPEAIAINLAVNDGAGDCLCPKCRAMDPPDADPANRTGFCDRYVKFENQVCEIVAREFPAKIIAFIAYGSMREPPRAVKLHPMLMPVLCSGGSVNAFAHWDEWMRMGARRMGLYLYHDDIAYFLLPKLDFHQSAKRIRYIVASGRARHFYQEMFPIWPLDAMVPYLENELLWDPRQDVDQILDEFYTRFFGPAAAPMKRFYQALESGYERWIAEEGLPHAFGKDKGSLSDGRSIEQFKVLNEQEADRAAAQLDEAVAAAKSDAVVAQRVDVVRRIFGFVAISARQYAAMVRLRSGQVASAADAQKMVADARQAVSLGRAQAECKRDVIEQPPASSYFTTFKTRSTNQFYDSIQVGEIHPQVLVAVSEGLGKASAALRTQLGPERAAAWWKPFRDAEKDPVLVGALALAAAQARGAQLTNLIEDPGFEDRGAGKGPKAKREVEVDHDVTQGLHVFHRRGTPWNCKITDEEAHGGRYSVCFTESAVAVLSESVRVKEANPLHVSVWVKHNDPKARYEIRLVPSGPSGKLTPATVSVPWNPGVWQEVTCDLVAPAGAKSLTLHVSVMGQSPGAKLWVDDCFIGKYPD